MTHGHCHVEILGAQLRGLEYYAMIELARLRSVTTPR